MCCKYLLVWSTTTVPEMTLLSSLVYNSIILTKSSLARTFLSSYIYFYKGYSLHSLYFFFEQQTTSNIIRIHISICCFQNVLSGFILIQHICQTSRDLKDLIALIMTLEFGQIFIVFSKKIIALTFCGTKYLTSRLLKQHLGPLYFHPFHHYSLKNHSKSLLQ